MSELVDQIAKLEATANKLKDSVSIDDEKKIRSNSILIWYWTLKAFAQTYLADFLQQNAYLTLNFILIRESTWRLWRSSMSW